MADTMSVKVGDIFEGEGWRYVVTHATAKFFWVRAINARGEFYADGLTSTGKYGKRFTRRPGVDYLPIGTEFPRLIGVTFAEMFS